MDIISTENLTKYYGKTKGIENLSLNVQAGEVFGFVGPNGSGKSTTIRTLLALIHKTSGKAKIFGLDTEKDNTEILKRVGYLPSEVFYYDRMSAKELLNYSASFYPQDCSTRIKELAQTLEVNLDQKIEDMSLGNKKKVGIIQGLLHKPELIILDEPTSGLDPLMQKVFFDLIKEENKKGATIFFSSHILSEVQRLCDRVAIIKNGSIVKIQKMEDLKHNQVKKVELVINEGRFNKELIGITDYQEKGNEVSFLYQGDLNNLVNRLNELKLINLEISEPSLEEVFLHYYDKD